MKKNHFYISYYGNKRAEMNEIYNTLNFEGIETVIEPYCGSCAMSYYIWTKHPNLKFVLNDNNKYLFEMFEIIRDNNKLLEFENKINDEILPIVSKGKTEYMNFVKDDHIYSWFIAHKYYSIRPKLYPIGRTSFSKLKFENYGIVDFFKNANIIFNHSEGVECYEKYKNDEKNLILFDPPYLNSCNTMYQIPNGNIYEYLYNNDINKEKARIYLILEDNWIIKLLFKNCEIKTYEKKYSLSKKKTQHNIIEQTKI